MSKRRRTAGDRQYDRERDRTRGSKRHRRVCVVCQAEFVGYHASLTCGAACRQARADVRRKHWPVCRVTWRACGVCKRTFPVGGERAQRRYCSELCIQERGRQHDQRYNQTRPCAKPKPCPRCGEITDSYGSNCDPCRKAVKSERRRREKTRRRKRLVVQERYTLAEIAERDGCRCGLCGRTVPMRQAVPHPRAPTIDHILPLAVGGDDTRANVQLAHFKCNWQKRDGGEQQLRLVG